MTTITLEDFVLYVTVEECYRLIDEETGGEWRADEHDGQVYVNSVTGEALFPNEIYRYYVVGLELEWQGRIPFVVAHIAKEV